MRNAKTLKSNRQRSEHNFSHSYRIARERFLSAAEQNQATVHSLIHPLKGPENEELACDVAQIGDPQAKRVLVISSGLHGAEAKFGSAVQLAVLEELKSMALPQELRIVMLHALNPWGFAYQRRVDEQNIDGNRNFLSAGESYLSDDNPFYEQLDPFLNPTEQRQLQRSFLLQAAAILIRHPYRKVLKAIASGQHRFPKGLFYGGDSPNWTTEQFTNHFATWLSDATHCFHLDFHTGLGKFSQGEFLIDTAVDEQTRLWLKKTYPAEVLHSFLQHGEPPYQSRGSINRWVQKNSSAAQTLSVCAEFGTYSSIKMLKVMRTENNHFHHSESCSKPGRKANHKLSEAFCPSSHHWRRRTLEQGTNLVKLAVNNIVDW